MYALLIFRPRLLQVSSVSVKGLLSPYSQDLRKETLSPNDPGLKSFEDIPGPPSLPVIGTLWDYYRGKYDLKRPHEIYSGFLKDYGPLVKENSFYGQTLVHIFDTKDMHKVYQSDRSYFPIRHSHQAIKKYRESRKHLYGHIGVAASNGEEWSNYRKLFQASVVSILKRPAVRPALEEIGNDFIKYIKSKLDHNNEMPLFPALYYYTLETIGVLMLGTRMGCFEENRRADVTRFIEAVHESHYAVYQTEHKPPIFTRKAYKTLEVAQDYIAHFVLKHMNHITDLMELESVKNIDPFEKITQEDDLMIKEDESNSVRLSDSFLYLKLKDGLSKRTILPMAVDFFQGGIHSTAHTLAFLFYHLAQNPEIQATLREELVQMMPNKTDPVLSSIKFQVPGECSRETLRLNPPTIGTGRILNEDLVLSGYRVPKGTKVILHHEIASKQEANFPEPLKFLPGRKMKAGDYTYNPFVENSRRVCMGRLIAEVEMKKALVKVFRHFEVSYHYEAVGVVNYLINEPSIPIKLRFQEIPDSVPEQESKTDNFLMIEPEKSIQMIPEESYSLIKTDSKTENFMMKVPKKSIKIRPKESSTSDSVIKQDGKKEDSLINEPEKSIKK